ncbi:hypothetical protein TEA_011190 [Camellia sinensis var. sinensis]|uniref:Glycosyltransferase n=1 Tax=Camellia sinensis var. sinensis TaxID=542762 RepID=A0A4S4E661_CAMSN|nr:hypothetical protein TEA_011190 [Camellia sinensis var. sinensis]
MGSRKQPHAVCVPFPAQGHINPMMQLAKLLHSRGFYITFVNTEFNHRRLLQSKGPEFLKGFADFQFETIPDGLPPSDRDATQDPPTLCIAIRDNCLDPFRVLLNKLNNNNNSIASRQVPGVTCVVSDGIMNFAMKAAEEAGIPGVQFWTASACGFMAYLHFPQLVQRGIFPFKDESFQRDGSLDTTIDWIPGMRNIRLKDMPSFIRTTDPNDILFNYQSEEVQNCLKASAIIFNTFDTLEHQVLQAIASKFATIDWIPGMRNIRLKDMPSFIRTTDPNDILFNYQSEEVQNCLKASAIIFNTFDTLEHEVLQAIASKFHNIYTIGPLSLLSKQVIDDEFKSLNSSLWKEDTKCLQWLDKKEPNSVVYVNYGSVTVMTDQHLKEFAWGLANSKHPFLWIVRPDIVMGDSASLPEHFVEETRDRGLLASWCPQEQVLSHPSIGVFLTHCGWNSTLESICEGVPIVCWPFFAEQQTNCRYACTEWGIGMEVNHDVKRDEVVALINEMLEGDKGKQMRKKVLELKKEAEEATDVGGLSYNNFDRLIKEALHYSEQY